MAGKKERIRRDYARSAGSYDVRYGSIQYDKFSILRGLSFSGVVVDLGGGTGLLGRHLDRSDLVNIDISFEMLKESDELNVCGDLDVIPLKSGCVDSVLSFTALQNLPDFSRVFGEVARILKRGGVFFCSVLGKGLSVSQFVSAAKLAGFRLNKKGKKSEDFWFVFSK